MTPPTAEGGALRSQDLRTPADPTTLDGPCCASTRSPARPWPATRWAAPATSTPAGSSPRGCATLPHDHPARHQRGLAGDVGWGTFELNRVVNPTAGVTNFGWPCYEGTGRQPGYDSPNLNICENLYAAGAARSPPPTTPTSTASWSCPVTCATNAGLDRRVTFYPLTRAPFPPDYRGALFFADYSRDCIWVMRAGTNGLPNPANRATFAAQANNPVDLEVHPTTGELWYADLGGFVARSATPPPTPPPVARVTANRAAAQPRSRSASTAGRRATPTPATP